MIVERLNFLSKTKAAFCESGLFLVFWSKQNVLERVFKSNSLSHLTRSAMLKNPNFAALFTTAYLVAFSILVALDYPDTAAAMFMLSPLLVIWMVYIVLRFGEASGRTFDEYYYDDASIRADKWRE